MEPSRPTTTPALRMLKRALRAAQGGTTAGTTLLLVTHNSPAIRSAALKALEAEPGAIRFGPETPDSTQHLFETLAATSDAYGAAHLVDPAAWPTGFEDLMIRLQYRRNALPIECAGATIVLWLDPEQTKWLATQCADLFAWRAGSVIDLSDPANTSPAHPGA